VVPGLPRLRPVHAPRVRDARDGLAGEALTANGQPALAAYAPEPGGGHRLHTLQVLTVTGGRVARNVVFADPAVFTAFGLPGRIPAGDFRAVR
jgi:RNA polymerase sigma-70 factor, ECF subfamily